jgi:hypothetical protein
LAKRDKPGASAIAHDNIDNVVDRQMPEPCRHHRVVQVGLNPDEAEGPGLIYSSRQQRLHVVSQEVLAQLRDQRVKLRFELKGAHG